jgi:hypothetical protein
MAGALVVHRTTGDARCRCQVRFETFCHGFGKVEQIWGYNRGRGKCT